MFKGILLIELISEELPINKLKYININFKKYIKYNLIKYNFLFSKIKVFVTIRRISCLVYNLSYNQYFKNKYKIIKGPKIKISKINIFNNNKLINWCKNINLSIKDIKYIKKSNLKCFFFKKKNKVSNIKKLILIILKNVFFNLLKNNKTIICEENKYFFFRPINNIIIMFNNKILDIEIFNIKSNNILFGHKFINNNKNIILNNANDYIKNLFKFCKVIIDYKYRKIRILNIIKNISIKKKLLFFLKNKYLKKIISMIEWPVGILCNFDKNFLFLPKDLITFIIEKYYGIILFNKKNILTNNFIIILDMKSNNYNVIIKGYENVINSELNEAKNFFIKDRKFCLISYLSKLKNIIFYKKIGTFLDKVTRILFLSKKFLYYLNYLNININFLNHVILLVKCDLATNLCKYYSNLKGIIGMHYSLLDGESSNISLIIKEHYNVDNNNIYSSIIFLVDKIDTLVSIFILYNFIYLEKKNDPYGLRKLSFLIIDKILNSNFYINIYNIISFSIFLFKKKKINKKKILIILNFINIRFMNYLNKLKISKNVIYSLLKKKKIYDFLDIKNRIDIILKYKNKEIFIKFINLYKRVNNLLKKYCNFNIKKFDINFLIKEKEITLYKYILYLYKKNKFLYINHNYDKLIKYFFISVKKINNFLNFVKIDVKNKNVKSNRIFLLKNINFLFNKFSNFKYYY